MGKILVIDDDYMNLRMVEFALSKAGYEVATEHSGLTGISYMEDHPVDLVLLDLEMPIMDGYQALEIMKYDDMIKPENVAFMTATIDDDVLAKAKEMGVLQCIKKPFLPDELTQIVAKMLEHKGV